MASRSESPTVFSNLTMAILLLLAAITIFFIELFVPSAGALFITGTACVIASLIYAFWVGPGTGVIFLFLVTALAAVLPGLFISIWKRTPIGRRMFLPAPEPEPLPATVAVSAPIQTPPAVSMPPRAPSPPPPDRVELVNRVGRAVTPLRPAGAIEIDGRRYDALTEGTMINRDETIRVVSVTPTEIVVRWHDPKAPEPPRRPRPAAPVPPSPELMAEVSKGLETISDIELDRPRPVRPAPSPEKGEVAVRLEDSTLTAAVMDSPLPVSPSPKPPVTKAPASMSPGEPAAPTTGSEAVDSAGDSAPSVPGSARSNADPQRDRLEDLNRRLENWSLEDEPGR